MLYTTGYHVILKRAVFNELFTVGVPARIEKWCSLVLRCSEGHFWRLPVCNSTNYQIWTKMNQCNNNFIIQNNIFFVKLEKTCTTNTLTLKTINALASFSSKAYDCILSSSYYDGCRKSEPIVHTSRFQRGQAIKSSAAVRLSFIPWHMMKKATSSLSEATATESF